MKRLKLLFLLIFLALAPRVSAQEVARGYFAQPDCGTIFGPTAYRVICLQLETVGNRTFGNEYQWTGTTPRPGDPANSWVQYNGTGQGAGTITSVLPGSGLSGGGSSGNVTISMPGIGPACLTGVIWNGSSWACDLGGLRLANAPPSDCSDPLTGKVVWDLATKQFTCQNDQTTPAGAGITTLNTLSGSVQSFVNDTNVTITSAGTTHSLGFTGTLAAGRLNSNVVQGVTNDTNVTGSISAQNLTLGFTGTLAKARQNAATVYSDAGTTYAASSQDFSAATLLVPGSAGYAPTASKSIGYNSTTNKYSVGVNGSNTTLVTAADLGTAVQAFDADLAALAGVSGTGFWSVTGAGSGAARTLQAGTGIAITNPAGIAGDPSIGVTSAVVLNNQTNTFTAGSKQIFSHSATTAGLNIGPVAGDPSTPANGDIWYNSSTATFRKRQNGSTTDLDTSGGSLGFSGITGGTNVNALVIGSGGSLAPTGTGTITANRTGCTTGQYLAFDGSCAAAVGSVDLAATYAWTGTHSFDSTKFSLIGGADPTKVLKWDLSGLSTKTTRTYSGPDADTRLLGDSDFSATGLMVRTAPNAYAGRQITGTNGGEFLITNPAGIAGNVGIALGTVPFLNNRSNTVTTGDQNLAAASSFTFPSSNGATPSSEGRCAQDTAAHRLKCHFGTGGLVTLAITSEVQMLNANLTALSGLTGVNNTIPIFTGVGGLTASALPPCLDSAGQHLNYDTATRTWSCGTSSTGGLSGATTNKFLLATGATTFDGTTANLTQAAGVINASGGFSVGDISTNRWYPNATGVTGEKEWTIQNIAGIPLVATTEGGAITDTNVAVFKTTGGITRIVNGGAAGSGTWTDTNSVAAGAAQNKNLTDALAGGGTGMVVKTQLWASFDGGSLTPDGSNCQDPVAATINAGPRQYVILCATPNSAVFDAVIIGLKQAVGTFTVRLKANDTVSTQTLAGTFKAQCRASGGAAPSSTWGSTQTVSITLTSADTTYQGITAAITPNGTCAAGSDLYLRYNATGGSNSATTRILGLSIEQAS